jgi:hypothetical protein
MRDAGLRDSVQGTIERAVELHPIRLKTNEDQEGCTIALCCSLGIDVRAVFFNSFWVSEQQSSPEPVQSRNSTSLAQDNERLTLPEMP